MAQDLLTREELCLLLADEPSQDPRAALPFETGAVAPLFSPVDFSTLQEVLETYLIPGVVAWSVLFSKCVSLGQPEISLISPEVLGREPSVLVDVEFYQGLKGKGRFVMPMATARTLAGLALGSQDPPTQLDTIHRSSLASVLKYLLAEMRSLIMKGTGRRSGTSDPVVHLWPEEGTLPSEKLVQSKIPWEVEGFPRENLLFWADLGLTRSLISLKDPRPRLIVSSETPQNMATTAPKSGREAIGISSDQSCAMDDVNEPDPFVSSCSQNTEGLESKRSIELSSAGATLLPMVRESPSSSAPSNERQTRRDSTMKIGHRNPLALQAERLASALPEPSRVASPGRVEPVKTLESSLSQNGEEVEIRVELGRGLIREPLKLGQIVSLDRFAGESADIFAGDELVARGEVAALEETLAVRITHIVVGRRSSSKPRPHSSGGRTS